MAGTDTMAFEKDKRDTLTFEGTNDGLLWGIDYRKLQSAWERTGEEIFRKLTKEKSIKKGSKKRTKLERRISGSFRR